MSRRTFIVAEVAQSHDGDRAVLRSLIDSLAPLDIDAVKFQMHLADAESSPFEPFRVPITGETGTRQDYWRRMEFTFDEWKKIKNDTEKTGHEFMCTPFSCRAVDWLEKLGIRRYKIGSGDVGNLLLLEKVGRTGKPVILSTGMSDFSDIDRALETLKIHHDQITLLQCTSQYPAPPEAAGLNVMADLRKRYGHPVGLSDHSGRVFPAIAAAGMGAKMLELHVTPDRGRPGPDASSSLTVDELASVVDGVRYLDRALANPVDKADATAYADMRRMFGRSLATSRDLESGHEIGLDDLEAKKPEGYGIPVHDFHRVVGRKLTQARKAYEFITEDDLS